MRELPEPQDRWDIPELLRRETVQTARDLRKRQTRSERMLWQELRGKKLDGLKFRRQYPIGPFVVDFCAPSVRLIVEVDGGVHDETRERDAERQDALERLGFRFVRVSAERVEGDLEGVVEGIRDSLTPGLEDPLPRPGRPSPPAPLPGAGEGSKTEE